MKKHQGFVDPTKGTKYDKEEIFYYDEGDELSTSDRKRMTPALLLISENGEPLEVKTIEEFMAKFEEVFDEWIIDPDHGVTYNEGAVRELLFRLNARLILTP